MRIFILFLCLLSSISAFAKGNKKLYRALSSSDLKLLGIAIQEGADVKGFAPVKGRSTTLITAVQNNFYLAIPFLIDKGADPNQSPDGSRNRPICGLIEKASKDQNQTHWLEYVIRSGASLDFVGCGENEKDTPLLTALKEKKIELVRVLLNHGADPNFPGMMGKLPLMYAVESVRNLEIIKLLLEKGADPNGKNIIGTTPLIAAASNGSYDFAVELMKANADPNVRFLKEKSPKRYVTALSESASLEQNKFVDLLLDSGKISFENELSIAEQDPDYPESVRNQIKRKKIEFIRSATQEVIQVLETRDVEPSKKSEALVQAKAFLSREDYFSLLLDLSRKIFLNPNIRSKKTARRFLKIVADSKSSFAETANQILDFDLAQQLFLLKPENETRQQKNRRYIKILKLARAAKKEVDPEFLQNVMNSWVGQGNCWRKPIPFSLANPSDEDIVCLALQYVADMIAEIDEERKKLTSEKQLPLEPIGDQS